MPADNVISRTDAAALIPEDVAAEVLKNVPEQSAALALFRSRTLARNQQRLPVKSVLPTAYFRNGDTGMMQTTEVNWTNVYLNVEEIDCVVPVPRNVFDDTDFDLWAEIRPDIEEAVGRALDGAVFFGANKPSSWPSDIVTAAIAAGNNATRGTNAAAAGGIAADIDDTMGTVEADGYDVNGFVTDRPYKSRLRKARDTTGQKLLDVDTSGNTVDGQSLKYAMRGLWPTGSGAAELIAGDFMQGVIGVRQDLEYEVWNQAVIQDPVTGDIVYNLAQQKMIALAVTARFAFAVPNPINRSNTSSSTRYPFAVLRAP